MSTSETIKKVEEFVYSKPRSIQEIAEHLGKNWRTADRYIDEIEKEFGTISTRVFRGGTRGALKIAYWTSVEKASKSVFQEQIETTIFSGGMTRDTFSAFDIFQHISDKKKEAEIFKTENEEKVNLKKLISILKETQNNLFIFSGNLSFINFKDDKFNVFETLEELVKRGVKIKIIGRVDISSEKNVKNLLSLNFKYGKDLIEVRHREQSLRSLIVDNKLFRIKEVKKPTGRENELKDKVVLFYTIKDKEWVEWLTKIFWKMFSSSIDAHKRLIEIEKLGMKHI